MKLDPNPPPEYREPNVKAMNTQILMVAMLSLPLALPVVQGNAFGAETGPPHLQKAGSATQLIVDGQPLLMLSGELHNSSSSSLDYLQPIWPRLAALNLNTVIASLSWELVEPEEGRFDFSLTDGILEQARRHNLKLVFIWFATWKNGDGTYVPAWVKTNRDRFPRCQHRPGIDTTQLTAFSEENLKADARAFAAVMRHLRQVDAKEHTVVMMQVENESGVMPVARDHCSLAEAAFAGTVPVELMTSLLGRKETLNPELKETWSKTNFRESGTWSQVFGDGPAAEEVFQAWYIARYIGQVAAAGKAEYPYPCTPTPGWCRIRARSPANIPAAGRSPK